MGQKLDVPQLRGNAPGYAAVMRSVLGYGEEVCATVRLTAVLVVSEFRVTIFSVRTDHDLLKLTSFVRHIAKRVI